MGSGVGPSGGPHVDRQTLLQSWYMVCSVPGVFRAGMFRADVSEKNTAWRGGAPFLEHWNT